MDRNHVSAVLFPLQLSEVESGVHAGSDKQLQQTCDLVARNLREGGYMMEGTFDDYIWLPIYRSRKPQVCEIYM